MREYFYICACGCGQKSETLKKDEYIRLRQDELWLAKGCKLDNAEEIREWLGGSLVRQSDY